MKQFYRLIALVVPIGIAACNPPNPTPGSSADVTAPSIVSSLPSDGQTIDYESYKGYVVAFSEPIDINRFRSAYDQECNARDGYCGNIDNAARWSADRKTVTISSNADPGHKHDYKIFEAYDDAGNAMTNLPHVRYFTTQDVPTKTLLSTSPVNGENNVAPNRPVVFEFSGGMDLSTTKPIRSCRPLTADDDSFCGILEKSQWRVSDIAQLTLTFNPATNGLGNKAEWTVRLSGHKDGFYKPLPPFEMVFKVADTVAPKVKGNEPSSGQTNVSPNSSIMVLFSEAMDRVSVESKFFAGDGAGVRSGTFVWTDDHRMYFKPNVTWLKASRASWRIEGQVKDLAGNLSAGSNFAGFFDTSN